jgi:hypothetical protein
MHFNPTAKMNKSERKFSKTECIREEQEGAFDEHGYPGGRRVRVGRPGPRLLIARGSLHAARTIILTARLVHHRTDYATTKITLAAMLIAVSSLLGGCGLFGYGASGTRRSLWGDATQVRVSRRAAQTR